jgi:hypothetical protein
MRSADGREEKENLSPFHFLVKPPHPQLCETIASVYNFPRKNED